MSPRAAILLALLLTAACGGRPAVKPATLALDESPHGPAVVEVRGLDAPTARWLRSFRPEEWPAVLSVTVGAGLPQVSGRYEVRRRTVRFIPGLPLERGRSYRVRFDPPGPAPPLTAELAPAAGRPTAATRVTGVYPSSRVWPENLLRFYIHFSAPMAPVSMGELQLIDDKGRPLEEPFLPLGYEFWSLDRTRLTVLLDPGRVKRGVLGEPVLEAGRRYGLVVGGDWRDAAGLTLGGSYRQTVQIGPAERRPLEPASWRISAPSVGTRTPIKVAFDRALDRALLMSALGVTKDGFPLAGRVTVIEGEAAWLFTPEASWERGVYAVAVGRQLEDPAGNRPGRAFEAAPGAPERRPDAAAAIQVPFKVSVRAR